MEMIIIIGLILLFIGGIIGGYRNFYPKEINFINKTCKIWLGIFLCGLLTTIIGILIIVFNNF